MRADYEMVVGLEVHVQLRTRTKLFCACPNQVGAPPNSLTCPVCLGLPGALPVLNAEAVRLALCFGLAVGAELRPRTSFYRKQYFYPDLPKGYQITQGPLAVVEAGFLEIDRLVGRTIVEVRAESGDLTRLILDDGTELAVDPAPMSSWEHGGI